MIVIDTAALASITPGAQILYRETFEYWDQLDGFGVLRSALRAEHFLAQVLHESGGLRVLVENLNYSAERLVAVWPTRFPTLEAAQAFAHKPQALANKVYGGRMGNTDPDDGWKFIGRGLLQLTGRSNYEAVGSTLSLDLLTTPTLVLDQAEGLRVAGEVWWTKQCNIFADSDNIERVTRAINGGLIGLAERRLWLSKVRASHVITERS